MTELWATFGRIATIIVLINADFCICLRLSSNFENENSRKMKQSGPFKLILLLSLVVYSIGGFCQQIPTINLVMKDGLSSNYVQILPKTNMASHGLQPNMDLIDSTEISLLST